MLNLIFYARHGNTQNEINKLQRVTKVAFIHTCIHTFYTGYLQANSLMCDVMCVNVGHRRLIQFTVWASVWPAVAKEGGTKVH